MLAIGADHVGASGLLIGQCVLAGLLFGAMVWFGRRRGLSTVTICLTANLVAINLNANWVLRPQLLSFIYFTVLLCLLAWCFRGWEGHGWIKWLDRTGDEPQLAAPEYSADRLRWLWLAPLIMLLWANSHGGFLAGYAIFAAYMGLRACEALACQGRSALGLAGWFALLVTAAGLATLINPYGPELHLWLVDSLGVPRPEINDFRAPDMLSLQRLPLWLMLAAMFSSLLLTRRSRDLTHLVILCLTLWQALEHRRHIPFFVIPCGMWMAVHIDSLVRRLNVTRWLTRLLSKPATQRAMILFMFGILLLQVTKLGHRTSALRVHRWLYPVTAFQYIEDRHLNGKMIVPYNWGQYALSVFGQATAVKTALRVSVDGRFRTGYPQEVIDMNFDFQAGDRGKRYRVSAFDDERVLEYGDPDLALVYRSAAHAVNVMFRNQRSWTLLYQDRVAQVWGRTTRYGNPESPDFIPFSERSITDERQPGWIPWPAFPVGALSRGG